MRILVESLKRLHQSKKVDEPKIRQMETDGKITAEEVAYILA